MAKGETVKLNTLESGAGGGESKPQFQTASEGGSKVFFTDTEQLTDDSTASGTGFPPEADLYECEMVEVARELVCRLKDLTVDHSAGEHADVQGTVLGASEDGSYIYFVANGVLAPGATPGHCESEATAGGTCNLYVMHNDGTEWTTTLVAILSSEDKPDWGPSESSDLGKVTSRVSADGEYLAFMSDMSLTGYDNVDVNSPSYESHSDEEVYLYNANADRLVCASCDPTGARPVGVFDSGGLLVDGSKVWENRWLAGSVPTWTPVSSSHALYQSRYLSDRGRLFFDSADALVPQATNGKEDVYEYEPEGEGSCTTRHRQRVTCSSPRALL